MSEDRNTGNNDRNLLSLELIEPIPQTKGIWATLRRAIENQVKRDGIRKDSILSFEIEPAVFKRAVDNIYDDVSEFYYWILIEDDEFGRYQYVSTQPTTGKRFLGEDYNSLREAVSPVVEDNLDAMRNADEITPEQDVEGLSEKITDNLTAYIMNWQDWFYDRKRDDDIEAYYEYMAEHASIYEDDYGTYNNLTNAYDESDVPYLTDRDI